MSRAPDPDDVENIADDFLADVPVVRASGLLRARAIWVAPIALSTIVVALMTLIYFGSIVDPAAHLHGLPVSIVNEDAGAKAPTGQIAVGRQVVSALTSAQAVTSRLSLHAVSLAEAEKRMNRGASAATIVIPPGFSASLLSLAGASPGVSREAPTAVIRILTNERVGSIAVGLAAGVAQPAIVEASHVIGQRLAALSTSAAKGNAVNAAAIANPISSVVTKYRALPSHSGLGLSAFYISLLSMMCGFLGATIVHNFVDSALGYATSEIGPWWTQRMPLRITRWQTLLTKWLVSCGVIPIVTSIMLTVAVFVLRMNAPHLGALWLYCIFGAIVIAVGTLTLMAALGTLGQLVALIVFIYLGLASSGGTVPLQALSAFYRVVAEVEPLRQILGGVRAILYFDAMGDAGLHRALIMTAAGLVFWIIIGAAVTVWYDRRGLHRLSPEVMGYVNKVVRQRVAEREAASGAS
jgi:YhgE/Pip-like protein